MAHSPQQRAADEAMQWLAVLQNERLAETRQREFRRWLAQCGENAAAWREAEAFWAGLDRLSAEDVEAIRAAGKPVSPPARRGYRPAALALAASLLLAVALWTAGNPALFADYDTAAGELRSVALADGSTLELDAGSAVSLDFNRGIRRVVLHQGQAFFSVAADPARPFEVVAGSGTVRALGTAFAVRLEGKSAEVTVHQHAVSIRLENGASLARLEAGLHAGYSAHALGAPQPADLQRSEAWRRHLLVFEDQPLAAVVRELNRYRRGGIYLVNAAVAGQRVTGSFDTRDPERALQTILDSLPLASTRLAGRWVLLYSRPLSPSAPS